jgi:hypothetical protein
VLGFATITLSDSHCGPVSPKTGSSSGEIREPGRTGGVLGFTLAPVLAVVALVRIPRARRARRPASGLAFTAALLALPLTGLNFVVFVMKAAFACGIGLL